MRRRPRRRRRTGTTPGAERARPRAAPPQARRRAHGRFGNREKSGARFSLVRVAPLLRLLAHVIEERGVAGELLHAGEAVDAGVRTGLQQPERERGDARASRGTTRRSSLSSSSSGTTAFTRPHASAVCGVVLAAEEPDLLRALLADLPREQADPVAAVERADARARLPEPRVVRGDREVAAQVQHVPAADRVAGDHRDDRLREAADLDLEVEHVEAADALLVDVAVVAADLLVAAASRRRRALARSGSTTPIDGSSRASVERLGSAPSW